MESPLQKIESDLKTAMKAKDAAKLSVLRMLKSALKNQQIEQKSEISESDFITTLSRLVKQRHESIAQYQKANRQDLADKEQSEIEILQAYLPQPLSEDELKNLIQKTIADVGAEGPQDMGKVMSGLKEETQGRVDGKVLASQVRAALS